MTGAFLIGLAAAVLLWTAPASADPIVFDFEDGLQGWEPLRVLTWASAQVLGDAPPKRLQQ